jgi:hypothetical protein
MSGEMVERRVVSAAEIAEQRAKGWSDWHPEHYCHRCGHPNLCWFTPSDVWNRVMGGAEIGPWNGIVCPSCFAEMAGGWPSEGGGGVCFALIPSRQYDEITRRVAELEMGIRGAEAKVRAVEAVLDRNEKVGGHYYPRVKAKGYERVVSVAEVRAALSGGDT